MKLLYQQMLAFFAVIITLVLVFGALFLNFTSDMVYKNTWTQLEGYSDSLMSESMVLKTADSKTEFNLNLNNLRNAESILKTQNVRFTIYTKKSKIIYPYNAVQDNITKEQWAQLEKGEVVHRTPHANRQLKTDMKAISMTDILKPYFYNGKLYAVISVGASVSNIQANMNQMTRNLVIAFIVSVIAGIILSYLLARYSVSRINRLRRATRMVADGNFDVHIESRHRDEIDDLAQDFDGMVSSLKESEKEIKRQEDRRRQFMADAAHEMRTPLTTINGLLEGLAYDAIPEESKGKSIELMRSETKRLIRLVNENLDYEKIRTNQITLTPSTFDSVVVINNIVEQLTKKSVEANDQIELSVPKSLMVFADYDRFVQVIFNITQNAIQFTESGTIHISAERGYHESIFRITDSGIGMTEDQLKNIWERYYKADPSRKNTKYGESGLGLSIVHQLMQLHNGKVEVTSSEGKGTTFMLTFPDQDESLLINN
ncbi:sensor histidine kinase [Dellaglioa carnosa]|uniref:histidine kinase n=1 Tax=Dellaglioa carnosa TaxID=2995136 RepID=A0ABT4JLZ2_9LACO|nr:HAMP domain-containing sensor histidine kinase [Dellaglioa carnosa]MCZ2490653.1 HAMP domain-containing histidine kinase [Dellaglioa carnosa]MCZ2493731.1 HAMP domain-containing histidine kinase [Dellaglioa carnosa]MDK1730595.1 HAMP domain-containing histidine kinase [Dellaglioa carnosa]